MLCINKSVCVYVNVERHGDGDWQWGSRQAGEWSEEKELNVRASESQVLRRHRRSVQGRVWNSVCNKLPHGCTPGSVCAWLCAWSVGSKLCLRRAGVGSGKQTPCNPVALLSVRSVVSSSWWTEGGNASCLRKQKRNPDFPMMFLFPNNKRHLYLIWLSL